MYIDDVVSTDYHTRIHINNTEHEHHVFRINASRIYLQYKTWQGSIADLEAMYNVKSLARIKYGFAPDELMIFSTINVLNEQIEEMPQSFLTIVLLSIESLLLVAFFLYFDLRSILLLGIMLVSCSVSVLASMLYFGYSLNAVTLMHFIMLPAFLCEFFFTSGYMFLFRAPKPESDRHGKTLNVYLKYSKKNKSTPSSPTAPEDQVKKINENENNNDAENINEAATEINVIDDCINKKDELLQRNNRVVDLDEVSSILLVQSGDEASELNANAAIQEHNNADLSRKKIFYKLKNWNLKRYSRNSAEQRCRLKKVKFVFYRFNKHVAFFLIQILLASVSMMHYCETYSFRALFVFLSSVSVHVTLHVFLFYPTLLCFFGTTWRFNYSAATVGVAD